MPRTKLRSDDEVLDAVGRAVLAHGPAALTLQHVGDLVGLAPATLLQRFGSKAAMLRKFARREAVRARVGYHDDVVELLVELAGAARTRREVANSVTFLVDDMKDARLRASAAAHAKAVERRIADLVGDRALAHALWCAQNGAVIQWAVRGTGDLGVFIRKAIAPILDPSRRRRRVSAIARGRH